jgi:hypothetical protein
MAFSYISISSLPSFIKYEPPGFWVDPSKPEDVPLESGNLDIRASSGLMVPGQYGGSRLQFMLQ